MDGRAWRCGRFTFGPDRAHVMGILNVTPDSFSDGGVHADLLAALEHGRAMALAGASIIDVGGESTRPGSDDVPEDEELRRVGGVVAALAAELDLPVSVDTRHAAVARECVGAGASIINDVSGFRDPAMVEVAVGCDAGLLIMHMLGEPKTMQEEPRYRDVVVEVCEYLLGQAAMLETAGVARDRIAIDPGIGFGKTTAHNLELLQRLDELASTGYPLVVGASRKRFIGELTGERDPVKRTAGSVGVALWCALHGASVVRVHDVGETVQAIAMVEAIGGRRT